MALFDLYLQSVDCYFLVAKYDFLSVACYMGSFPQPQHFFAAAQENEDIGALWKGPSIP